MTFDTITALNLIEDRLIEYGHRLRDDQPAEHTDAVINLAQYGVVIELLHIVSGVRNAMVEDTAAELERVLTEAAPAGATPTVTVNPPPSDHTPSDRHPSTLPPDKPRLHVVKETDDADE